jgi:hypothetical protein
LNPGHGALGSGKRDAVGDLITVRFGSEATEFALSEKAPKVGDLLRRNGDNWVVVEVNEDADGKSTVVLQPGIKEADAPIPRDRM